MATMLPPSARMGQIQNSAREEREAQANHEAALKALQEQYPMPRAPQAAPAVAAAPVVEPQDVEAAPEVPVVESHQIQGHDVEAAPVASAPVKAVTFNDKMTRRDLLDLAASLGLELDPASTKASILAALTLATKAN